MLRWLRGVMVASSVPAHPLSNPHSGYNLHTFSVCLGCRMGTREGSRFHPVPSGIAIYRS
jgi:hypothetical protein